MDATKDRIRLETHPGLGDAVITLAMAYAVSESGGRPSVECHQNGNGNYKVTQPKCADLPVLPMLSDVDMGAAPIAIHDHEVFNWIKGDLVRDCVGALGLEWGTTPVVGAMQSTERSRLVSAGHLIGYKGYVVISPDGNCWVDSKCLGDAQIMAIAAAAVNARLLPVIVGAEVTPRTLPENVVDLRGKTTLRDLCSIIEHATAVVSAETGASHVAAGYWVPTLVIAPSETKPHAVVPHYKPFLWLDATRASDVPVRAIREEAARLFAAAQSPWCIVALRDGVEQPCGVAASGRRIAEAAGVPFQSIADGIPNIPFIAEYHSWESEQWEKWLPGAQHPIVFSVHQGITMPEGYRCFARGKAWYRHLTAQGFNPGFVPLPTFGDEPGCAMPGLVMAHGIPGARKNSGILKAAVAEARKAVPEARLEIVAAKPGERAMSEAAIRANLSRAACFVYPYSTECSDQSAAVADVLCYGRPVIVSDAPCMDDYRGWCVTAPVQVDALAEAIVAALSDPDAAGQRALMGASYRTPQMIARQYHASLVQRVLDGGKP
jgi:hypothetical protein